MYFYLPTARARRLVSQLCALVSVPLHFIRRSEKLSRKRSKAFKSDSLQPYIKLYKRGGERKAVYGVRTYGRHGKAAHRSHYHYQRYNTSHA